MPYIRINKCVHKKNTKEKVGCSDSVEKAKDYLKALYANEDDNIKEIKDYFNNMKDEDYMFYNGHPLASIENLMDPEKPAPWDHETNEKDDEDVDVDLRWHFGTGLKWVCF